MDAINALTPGSPTRPRRSERGRKMLLQWATIHLKAAATAAINLEASVATRWCKTQFRTLIPADEYSRTRPPPVLDSRGSPTKIGKTKRRDDTKPSSRTTSRRNPARGNEKSAGPTRRQVYREKQVKEPVKELSLLEETTPSAASPNTTSDSTQGSQRAANSS
ncbi:hypothetical protein GQ600_12618 [Phytophthora cactorum]|nr:hypothetical protein GQ600_12618 [Phytophthora cactorum]